MLRFVWGSLAVLVLAGPARAQEAAPPTAQLLVESTGRPQTVELHSPGAARSPLPCQTPCRLQIAPGAYELVTYGRGVRRSVNDLTVAEPGLHVRVRAASRAAAVWGWILSCFGAGASILYGSLGVAALTSAPGDPYNQMMAAMSGLAVLLVGAPSLIIGLLLLDGASPGLASRSPLPEVARLGAISF